MVGYTIKTDSPELVDESENSDAGSPTVGDPPIGNRPQSLVSMQSQVHRYQIGGVYHVPLGLIKSNPVNPRAIYTMTSIEEMAASLRQKGQMVAVLAFIHEGEVVLIEGETRLRGARQADLATLRVEIRPRPEDDQKLYELARLANVDRRDQTPLDDAIRWKELLLKKVYPTQVALAKAMGMDESIVSRTLALSGLPRVVMNYCAEYPVLMTYQMLNAIRGFYAAKGDADATVELMMEVAKTGMGYRDVAAKAKALANGPIKRPRASRDSLTYKGAVVDIRTFQDGRIQVNLTGVSAEVSAELSAKIRELFIQK
jgi:ParB family chromosome partitioning protein